MLKRIPVSIKNNFKVEVLIIDDKSSDDTSKVSKEFAQTRILNFRQNLYNRITKGMEETKKIGYHYAIKNNFDYVALVHGDGQYPPEYLPKLMKL